MNPPDIKVIHDIFLQLITGLAYIHSKEVILGDVKPANILYIEVPIKVVFTDFDGSSVNKICVSQSRSYEYLPPERIPFTNPTIKGNIWSLAIIMGQLRSDKKKSRTPYEETGDFQEETIKNDLIEGINEFSKNLEPTSFKPLIQRMLNVNPNLWPPCQEIETELKNRI